IRMRMILNCHRIAVRDPTFNLPALAPVRARELPSVPPRAPPGTSSFRRMRLGMGTWVAIEATAESETVAARAIEAAFAAFAAVEQRMHPTRAGSDVARVNAAALGVNAGGDLRLFGARPETILLRRAGHGYRPLVLENAALAVSDLDEPRRPPEHQGYYIRGTRGLRPDTIGTMRRHAAVLARD